MTNIDVFIPFIITLVRELIGDSFEQKRNCDRRFNQIKLFIFVVKLEES